MVARVESQVWWGLRFGERKNLGHTGQEALELEKSFEHRSFLERRLSGL